MPKLKVLPTGLTFDDVLLVPAYSDMLPREVNIETWLTKTIKLNAPLISAAMDAVSEWPMAIAMARQGGIAIIHKNMSIENQAVQIRAVKRAENAIIFEPITLLDTATVAEAERVMEEKKIGGIPILNQSKKLVGIVTKIDLRSVKDKFKLVSHVMTSFEKMITAKIGTDLNRARDIMDEHKIKKLPIVNNKGELHGLFTYRDIRNVREHPQAAKDKIGRLLVGAAVGVTSDILKRIEALRKEEVDVIVIDTAHGHSKGVVDAVKSVRKHFGKDLQIIVGNVATKVGAEALIKAGANAIKVGIGPGSICTTRIIAGVGVPQLTAIMEVAKACKNKVPCIADGGIKYTGDITKALAAGADVVMIGSLFAGVEESPGEIIIHEGRKYKTYRGMGSVEAMQQGSKDRYFQDVEDDIKKLVPEGIVGMVPLKGSLFEIVYQMIGGLRAGMGYCGAANIKALQEAKFIQITTAGSKESHPHGVVITKEAPNYSSR